MSLLLNKEDMRTKINTILSIDGNLPFVDGNSLVINMRLIVKDIRLRAFFFMTVRNIEMPL